MVNAEQRIDMVRKNIRCVCVLYTIYNKNTMQLNRRERQYHIKKKKNVSHKSKNILTTKMGFGTGLTSHEQCS